MSASTASIHLVAPEQKIFERIVKTHAKILIGAKRRSARRRPSKPPPPPPSRGRGRGSSRGGSSSSSSSGRGGSSSSRGGRTSQQQQNLEHQQRVNRIRNDKTQTLAQRKEAIERENYRFRNQQQQQQPQQQQQEERIRRNTRDAKYTSRYMDQRRPRRYHRRYNDDGSTIIVAGGAGGYGYGGVPYYGGGGYGGAPPYYGDVGASPYYGGEGGVPSYEQPYTTSTGTIENENDEDDEESSASSSSSTTVIDSQRPKRILNVSSLRRTHVETSVGEFRDIPALEGVDTDVLNEYLRLRAAFDVAETPNDRIKASVAFALFTLKIDRIFKTHTYVYVRAMKYRPATLSTKDVEDIVDALPREEVERLALLTNEDLRLFLENQVK